VAAGVNDQKQHADELADLLHHWNLGRHVNIIPYNPIADSEFQRPTKASVSLPLKSMDLSNPWNFLAFWQYVEVLV
jgi:adenine C2-methylase RlmN of 23S rRNA A2503 and tRNA A37